MVTLSIFIQKKIFFAENMSSSGAAMLVCPLPKKSKKKEKEKKGWLVTLFDTFATHASLVRDSLTADYWARSGIIHSRVSKTFKC